VAAPGGKVLRFPETGFNIDTVIERLEIKDFYVLY